MGKGLLGGRAAKKFLFEGKHSEADRFARPQKYYESLIILFIKTLNDIRTSAVDVNIVNV